MTASVTASIVLSARLHGAWGAWDEIILIGLGVLVVLVLVGMVVVGRRWEPEMEDSAESPPADAP